jgi:hypothetical protein
MIYVKIMSGEDMPDGNNSKGFQIFECEGCTFRRILNDDDTETPVADIVYSDKNGEEAIETTRNVVLTGNAYVLNEAGRTIGSFAFAKCRQG